MKSLAEQIGSYNPQKHGGFAVKLYARSKNIYGIVFASYVMNTCSNDDEKEKFYNEMILKKAEKLGFRYHDLTKPYFRDIFEDVIVKVLGRQYCVTLKAGLWKLKEQ